MTFDECRSDDVCRTALTSFMRACAWNESTNECSRSACLQAITDFYTRREGVGEDERLRVDEVEGGKGENRSELAHRMFFCR